MATLDQAVKKAAYEKAKAALEGGERLDDITVGALLSPRPTLEKMVEIVEDWAFETYRGCESWDGNPYPLTRYVARPRVGARYVDEDVTGSYIGGEYVKFDLPVSGSEWHEWFRADYFHDYDEALAWIKQVRTEKGYSSDNAEQFLSIRGFDGSPYSHLYEIDDYTVTPLYDGIPEPEPKPSNLIEFVLMYFIGYGDISDLAGWVPAKGKGTVFIKVDSEGVDINMGAATGGENFINLKVNRDPRRWWNHKIKVDARKLLHETAPSYFSRNQVDLYRETYIFLRNFIDGANEYFENEGK